MMGLLSFFNPQVLGAIGLSFLIGITTGGILEYRLAHAGEWQAQVAALKKAHADQEKQLLEDAKRADANLQDEKQRSDNLQKIINDANANPAACRFNQSELGKLCQLAGAGRQCGRPLPATGKRPTS